MNINNGSASALIETGRGGYARSGSKFDFQIKVLKGICANPGATINEISVYYFDWYRQQYASAPKRARDLVKLGFIEQLANRQCKYTGKSAHTYRITPKGIEKLKMENAMPEPKPDADKPVAKSKSSAVSGLAKARKLLA